MMIKGFYNSSAFNKQLLKSSFLFAIQVGKYIHYFGVAYVAYLEKVHINGWAEERATISAAASQT